MSVRVYSARLGSYRGADGLNVTRQFGGMAGGPFAPSWPLLNAARAKLQAAETDEAREAAWRWYEPLFLAEMRGSFRTQAAAWKALLARDEVTLLCVCPDGERCHRRLLRRILETLGAEDCGERAAGGDRASSSARRSRGTQALLDFGRTGER